MCSVDRENEWRFRWDYRWEVLWALNIKPFLHWGILSPGTWFSWGYLLAGTLLLMIWCSSGRSSWRMGVKMAECLLTSVGGCLRLWGQLWPGWLNPYNWSGHRAVKPMTEELSVPENPSGLRRIAFPMLSIAQFSGRKFVNWAVRTPASHFPLPSARPRTRVLLHISCCLARA